MGRESVPRLMPGDAALAVDDHTCAAVLVADCLPVALGSPEGIRAAVHAGWRGLVAGVIGNGVVEANSLGATKLVAAMGPCIGPCCYEFSPAGIADAESALGMELRASTKTGKPSLDLRSAARKVLADAGVRVVFEDESCTSCGSGWFSARARKDPERQALYVWRVGHNSEGEDR
jgi:hypothetical protein